MQNQLGSQTSPYLLQHKDNPVHWQPWGEAALAQAEAEGKPILLSVGYAACHWCHVMAHECFEDPAIANLMNELFVNIKVDREEQPDVDAIYQAALALMGQQGGWPLTIFLNGAGEPFWGGTYFPPEPRFGRPGFPDILRRVAEVYHTEKNSINENTQAILQSLRQLAAGRGDDQSIQVSISVLDQVARQLTKQVDPFHGGIGEAPKFPQCYALEAILRGWLRTGDGAMARAVETSLVGMCEGGIYDHLGGGFARYSTDSQWLAPHFEKMLYDNAQIIDLLALAWQATGKPLFEQRLRETVDWVLREMIAAGGGFAATLDADSEGEEGRFYVWSEAEVDRILGDEAPAFKLLYDVSAGGNWEGKNILNRTGKTPPEDDAVFRRCREKLLAEREKRLRPGWDDKVLADWNGLMIAALANAAEVFAEPGWTEAAVSAYRFVHATMQPDGRLHHAHRDGQTRHRALLDDYANMALAALALYESTGERDYLADAETWVAAVEEQFPDADNGGYFSSPAGAGDLIARLRHCNDNAVPSGNGVMLGVLTRLWLLTGKQAYVDRAEGLLAAFASQLPHYALAMTTYLNSAELLLQPRQIVIVGDRDDAGVGALLRVLHGAALPNRVLQVVPTDATLPQGHPAAGKGQAEGRATAYVCLGQTCSLPLTDPDALSAALAGPTTD
ncbi:MAG: thioredoxin domain-containing protein [Alphaproteobacteria bacterium]|nr:thioredoxin domain-containing protein [Alphaproteobacteria bacterium]